MNENILASVTWKLQALSEELDKVRQSLLNHDVATASGDAQAVDAPAELGVLLNERRKQLGIDLAMLELQTGVSISTLKRLFKDPEQVKFGTVFAVARALGVKLCTAV
ncbi:helix-turn-helix domain-containing protein [Atlantibacter hermannii]|uniref:helix-turn-helix domain-containing protein n=1 Tax=Atlantibacter hermannii TaxID=565 RepID=UPI001931B518|nr:helix-turn-helix transcriptional regulator [Atlantibacter hermannii]MBL7636610.1 helix-turn-helix transcriptional regulator [Atlantibacter hermannii]MBL7673110.1 helix-turn-helix transcriptional regulator [Atlantibacter hermannii]